MGPGSDAEYVDFFMMNPGAVVQASANTSEPNILDSSNPNQWTYNWGSDSLYANTITVGMWNTDPQDNWHATSPHLMPEIDIYADGVKNTFEWSLGTSYATPAVAAEVVNFLSYVTGDAEFTSIDEYYDALFNHLSEADPSFSNVSGSIDIDGADYTAFIDTIIEEITTEVEITFDDGSTKTVNVLETDADASVAPHDSNAGYGSYFPSSVSAEMYFEEEKNGAAPVSYAAMETITPDSYNVSQLASSDDVYEAPEIDASGMEFIELGSGDDVYFASDNDNYIVTYGGSDLITGGAGDDIIHVAMAGALDNLTIATGGGANQIIIDENATGSYTLIAEGEGDTIYIDGMKGEFAMDVVGNDVVLIANGIEITLQNQFAEDATSIFAELIFEDMPLILDPEAVDPTDPNQIGVLIVTVVTMFLSGPGMEVL